MNRLDRMYVSRCVLFAVMFGLTASYVGACSTTKGSNGAPTASPSGLSAVLGVTPALISVSSNWRTLDAPKIGLSVRYPEDWKGSVSLAGTELDLYPPDADLSAPGAFITFALTPGNLYSSNTATSNVAQVSNMVKVGGIEGQVYDSPAYSVPTERYLVLVPYRSGTLVVGATKGPIVNLVPQLDEILKTVSLKP